MEESMGNPGGGGGIGGGGLTWAKVTKLANERQIEAKIILVRIFISGHKSMKKRMLSKQLT